MYKDRQKQKEANREAKRKSRQGMTEEGMTNQGMTKCARLKGMTENQGMTLFRYVDGKKEILDELPEGYHTLSDGQVWKPQAVSKNVKPKNRIEFIKQELNDPYLIKDIEKAGLSHDDRETRYERAYRYKLWREGKPVLEMDKGTAGKLLQVCQSLKNHNVLSEVRYGTNGPTMETVLVRLAG